MDSAAIPSLTLLFDGIDRWAELAPLLPVIIALIFRVVLILMAQWVLNFWPLQLLAALYLLLLSFQKFKEFNSTELKEVDSKTTTSSINKPSVQTVLLLAFTDLAFSIDSVAAAVSISDQFLLVITGGIIGVIALRFTSGLFIKWLEVYPKLELAGYIAVALVGVKLILLLSFPGLDIREWIVLLIVSMLFGWGFSKKVPEVHNKSS